MKRIRLFLLALSVGLFLTGSAVAQVRIGDQQVPTPGTVLDLSVGSPATAVSYIGGLKLAQVTITDLSEIPTGTNGFTDSITTTEQKLALKGVLVYNKVTTGSITEGIYCWMGAEWRKLRV